MKLLESLKWRYATKQYDATKKISEEQLNNVMEAIQLSPSSYGLQLFQVLIIENPEVREQLKPASWGQPQITDASHLLVFCNFADVKDEHIDEYLHLKAEKSGLKVEDLQGYGDFIKGKMNERSLEDKQNWTARQTYIALGNALSACAEMNIDATPMEGFEPEKYDEILGLKDKGLQASVVMAIGYRSEEDQTQHAPKIRKSKERLFVNI